MVLDLGLPDMSGFELLETVKAIRRYARPADHHLHRQGAHAQEETKLRKFAETIIVKDVKSPERLLDETALFLHRVEAQAAGAEAADAGAAAQRRRGVRRASRC